MRIAAILAVLLTASVAAPAARAAESYDNCTGTIASLPAVISTPGVWCMKGDLSTALASGEAIEVTANNVTIDCNDFRLGGLSAGPASVAIGIYSADRSNIRVRRCNIRGFFFGVYLQGGSGHQIEDNRFDGNLVTGILTTSQGAIIRNNLVIDTGGSTATEDAVGIGAHGFGHVIDNTVDGVQASGVGTAHGIATTGAGTITGNRVSGVIAGTGDDIGIIVDSNYGLIDNNYIYGNVGLTGTGIKCNNSSTTARGNVIAETVTGVTACYSTGNIVQP